VIGTYEKGQLFGKLDGRTNQQKLQELMNTVPPSREERQMSTTATDQKSTMKAIVCHKYGSPEVLELEEVDRPVVKDDAVLVRVKAASVNPLDWHLIRGMPYFVRTTEGLLHPKRKIPGVDLADRLKRSAET